MTLTPIGDIGVASLAEISEETVTWDSAADWDTASAESGVAHENVADTDYTDDSAIRMGYSYQDPLNTGLLAFLPLDDVAGSSTAQDLSGNGNDASVNGAALDAAAVLGTTGADLDGDNDWIEIPNIPALESPNELTVAAWFNLHGFPGESNTVYKGGSGNDNFGFRINSEGNQDVRWLTDAGNGTESGASASTDEWNLWSGIYDGDSGDNILYKNGSAVDAAGANTGGLVSNSNPIALGRRGNSDGRYMDAVHGAVWIWDRVLTPTEHSALSDVVNGESSLTTATKSFSSPVSPDLQNLIYTLNSQTINLDVVGSPGTQNEEIHTVAMDGNTSYSIGWNDSHTDFHIRVGMATADMETTPTVSRIELAGLP